MQFSISFESVCSRLLRRQHTAELLQRSAYMSIQPIQIKLPPLDLEVSPKSNHVDCSVTHSAKKALKFACSLIVASHVSHAEPLEKVHGSTVLPERKTVPTPPSFRCSNSHIILASFQTIPPLHDHSSSPSQVKRLSIHANPALNECELVGYSGFRHGKKCRENVTVNHTKEDQNTIQVGVTESLTHKYLDRPLPGQDISFNLGFNVMPSPSLALTAPVSFSHSCHSRPVSPPDRIPETQVRSRQFLLLLTRH